MTWILILMLSGSGRAMTQVTGYTSLQKCQEGGRAFEKDSKGFTMFRCIPAPEKSK